MKQFQNCCPQGYIKWNVDSMSTASGFPFLGVISDN